MSRTKRHRSPPASRNKPVTSRVGDPTAGGSPAVAASPPSSRTEKDAIVIQIEPGVVPAAAALVLVGIVAVLWAKGVLHVPALPEIDATASLSLIFVTGLVAGGLSCLAVQGGLLATTIAQREQRFIEDHVEDRVRTADHAAPIVLFLAAKLAAYTALGAVLGLFGSFVSLSPTMRGGLQIAIGLFMLGVALQMLNVHPIFRYFALEPPKRARRLIRKHAKRDDAVAPLFLGALTVLIPCGVTQAVELVAIASGSPARGALIMFAFVLGTSPVFFVLGLLATRLSATLHRAFLKLAATAVALLAILSIVSGYRLLPYSFGGSSAAAAELGEDALTLGGIAGQGTTISVQNYGYEPSVVQVKAGVPTTLSLITNNVMGCTRAFVIPALNLFRVLPATGTETIDIPALSAGRLAYSCSMGMYGGVIEVVQ